jgi:predicted RNA-binding protein Jag
MSLTPTEQIKEIIEEILAHMTIQGQVAFEESQTRGAVFNISSNEGYLLIGRQGINLQALQLVVQVFGGKAIGVWSFPKIYH